MESSADIYKTPDSALATQEPAPIDEDLDLLYSVSTLKLIVMSLFTLGLYQAYWFYKNWECMGNIYRRAYSSFWRAIFSIFWAYRCFRNIADEADRYSLNTGIPPSLLAFAYVVMHLTQRMPDPIWIISLFSFAAIIPANNTARRVNRHLAPHYRDAGFSKWNWFFISLFPLSMVVIFVIAFVSAGQHAE